MKKSLLALLAQVGSGVATIIACILVYYGCFRGFLSARFFLHETVWTNRIADSPVTVGLAFYFICFTLLMRFWKHPFNFFYEVFENIEEQIDRRWDPSTPQLKTVKEAIYQTEE